MIILSGKEEEEAMKFFIFASEVARNSLCLRAKTGAIIVKDGEIIGEGFNTPPLRKKLQRCIKDNLPEDYKLFKSDRTCCVHAEQVAIYDALRRNPNKLEGSRIYFARLDKEGIGMEFAGKPYCTHCSKAVLYNGITEFALRHKDGIYVYNTREYNTYSFRHFEWIDET